MIFKVIQCSLYRPYLCSGFSLATLLSDTSSIEYECDKTDFRRNNGNFLD